MYKNKPKPETKQATLARVKEEMDEPRMAESTWEEVVDQTTRQKLEKLTASPRNLSAGCQRKRERR
jgi:hypothetical protein